MRDRFDHTLEHTLDTKPDGGGDDAVTSVRRIELITGTGRRRQWLEDDKARIIVESLRPGVNVSEVARRNGLSPQLLFGWRREARALMAEKADGPNPPAYGDRRSAPQPASGGSKSLAGARPSADAVPAFASVVIAAPASPSPPSPPAPPASDRIEIVIGDTVVRVIGPVEPATLTAVLRAVRRAS